MAYAGTSWEGPRWRARVAARPTLLGRLRGLPRAAVVAASVLTVAMSLAVVAPAAQAHYLRGPSCSADALRPYEIHGPDKPLGAGVMRCSYSGWNHYFEVDLYYKRAYRADPLLDWTGGSGTWGRQNFNTAPYYYWSYGCYYSYAFVSNHDSESSGCFYT